MSSATEELFLLACLECGLETQQQNNLTFEIEIIPGIGG